MRGRRPRPQANAGTWLGDPAIGGQTVADVLRLEATIAIHLAADYSVELRKFV
jgi:hypothetical protein